MAWVVRKTIFSLRVFVSPVSIFVSVSFLINKLGKLVRIKETIKIQAFQIPSSKTGIRSMLSLNALDYFSVANQLRELKEKPEIALHIRPKEELNIDEIKYEIR